MPPEPRVLVPDGGATIVGGTRIVGAVVLDVFICP
jgi:hypothetical protein